MKYPFDLHIHSALSPCGDSDMTPNNIVNMAIIKGLEIIAVSDHNTAGNLRAVAKAAEGTNLLVVPAMEIETSEEVHLLCLFETIEQAEKMSDIVMSTLFINNKSQIFGEQTYIDSNDKILGCEQKLLVTATSLSLNETAAKVKELGGIVIPAHIDRSSYSILSNLGFLPDDAGFTTLEISKKADLDSFLMSRPELVNYNIIVNSDAHYLEDIQEKIQFINLEEKTVSAVINKLS